MIRLETEIFIEAPPTRVWQVLMDFASYPSWNPLVLEAKGEPRVGASIDMKVTAPDGSGRSYGFRARVVRLEEGKSFAWTAGLPGILTGVHYLNLMPEGSGTKLVHGEDFSGLYPFFMGRKRILAFKPAYEAMNRALAERAKAR